MSGPAPKRDQLLERIRKAVDAEPLDRAAAVEVAVYLDRAPDEILEPLMEAARELGIRGHSREITFSRNIFIPLQLQVTRRHPKKLLWSATTAFTVSFLLVGVWHAFTLNFLAWGAFQAAGLVVCNLYRHGLQRRLGRKGVRNYMTIMPVRIVSTIATFEFFAFSLYIIA